jgi:hypothetical protein
MLGKILIEDEEVEFDDPNRFNLVSLVSEGQESPLGEKVGRSDDCGCKTALSVACS